MKRAFALLILAAMVTGALACTSAIVSGRLTANGRPLLWKNRDTNDMNNRVERIAAHDDCMEFVALFDARDTRDTAAWLGFNTAGFAIMNTASYNINRDNVKEKDMDKEGVVMRRALEKCLTVDDFRFYLDTVAKPLGVEANFGVIDALGNGAYFETGNYTYKIFDLKDAEDGIIVRTNYSHSGRPGEGHGYIREKSALQLLAPHIAARDITPAVFTEELSRTFYNSLLGKDYTKSGDKWIVDQDFIPRRISTASIVIEGVLPGENPSLTTMWTALGYPPCATVIPVWTGDGGVPEVLQGTGADNHAPQCDKVLRLKEQVFHIKRGNGKHYIDLSTLYNSEGTGISQQLIPQNMENYRQGYKTLEQRRNQLNSNVR